MKARFRGVPYRAEFQNKFEWSYDEKIAKKDLEKITNEATRMSKKFMNAEAEQTEWDEDQAMKRPASSLEKRVIKTAASSSSDQMPGTKTTKKMKAMKAMKTMKTMKAMKKTKPSTTTTQMIMKAMKATKTMKAMKAMKAMKTTKPSTMKLKQTTKIK